MINKRISKITMLTALFVAGVVNAQEFYTCVPKRSWWMDTMGESIKRNVPSANDIAKAVKGAIPPPTPNPEKQWVFVNSFFGGSQELSPGTYRLIEVVSKREEEYNFTIYYQSIVTISDSSEEPYLFINGNKKFRLQKGWRSGVHDLYVLE